MTVSSGLKKTDRLLALAVVVLLLGYLIVFGIVNFAGFTSLCTADMYEDTLVAKLMWEQKTLFPEGFVFGNQFYVVATPVLAALIYGLTGNLNVSMGLATTLMTVFIFSALLWLLRPLVKSRLTALCALLAMVSCVFAPIAVFQDEGQLFFVLASFYACYLLCALVVMGDYVRAGSEDRLRPVALGLALLLCFGTGMQSLRQTCVTILPLLAYELLAAMGRKRRLGAFWPKGSRRPLRRCLAYALANLLGCGLIRLLAPPQYVIYNGSSIFDGASLTDKLHPWYEALRAISGFDSTQGEKPVFFCLAFAFWLLLLVGAVYFLLRRKGHGGLAVCWWVTLIGLGAVVAASVVTSVNARSVYLFMYYPLLVFSLVLVMDRLKPPTRRLLVLALCLYALVNLHYSYRENLDTALDDTPTDAQLICDLALERGCDLVYGSHNAAPFVALCSNGRLTAGSWDDIVLFKVIPYTNMQNIYSLWDSPRAVFVFLPWELEGCRAETAANGAELTLLGEFGQYTVFSSSRQLLYPLSW